MGWRVATQGQSGYCAVGAQRGRVVAWRRRTKRHKQNGITGNVPRACWCIEKVSAHIRSRAGGREQGHCAYDRNEYGYTREWRNALGRLWPPVPSAEVVLRCSVAYGALPRRCVGARSAGGSA